MPFELVPRENDPGNNAFSLNPKVSGIRLRDFYLGKISYYTKEMHIIILNFSSQRKVEL